jgi:type II secretory pathway pseudopilin PulG
MPAIRRGAGRRSLQAETGFSIVESLIALGLVFGVVVALLATVNTGIRGVVTGRQRSVALSIANEVMETARSRSYADVGHDLDSDPTLAADPAITGTVPNLLYANPSPAPPEELVGSVVDAGIAAGINANPLFPFSPHRWTSLREATTYTTTVYVTWVVPASGDPYRRLTVLVTWDKSLNAPQALPATVRLSSFLFNVTQPPDPLFVGLAEADAGTVTVVNRAPTGDLTDARLWLPYAHGEIDSRFVRRATGYAGTARSVTKLRSGLVSGCTMSNGGLTAECAGVKAETGSDNDAATAPPDHDPLATADPGGTLTAGAALTSSLGAGTARSLSTARSCWSCYGPGVDDDDLLPYQWAQATGPATLSMPFTAGAVTGSLVTAGGACITCSTVTLDRDDVSGARRLATTAAVAHPAIDVVTLAGAIVGYAGMVRVGPTSVATSATSGPGALAPSFTAGAVAVQVYDTTTVLPGYRAMTITPGTPSETTSHAEMVVVGGALVVMDATIRSGPAVTLSTPSDGALAAAQASLSNWLTVDVHLVVTNAGGTAADLDVSLDYGRVTARATYQPAPA